MLASNAGAIFPRNYRRRENMTIEAYAPLRDQPEHVDVAPGRVQRQLFQAKFQPSIVICIASPPRLANAVVTVIFRGTLRSFAYL